MNKYILILLCLSALCSNCSTPAPTPVAHPQTETPDTITLLFAGDIMCHKPQVTSAQQDSTYDFTGWFQHVKPIIQSADLAFANLETTLSSTGRYSGYPRFKSPDQLGYALEEAGFDVVVTSNNHSNDTGPKGVKHTIEVLKSVGLYQTGTFNSKLDKELNYPLIVDMAEIKIALLNYTYNTNGIPTRPPVEVNLLDTVDIKADIIKAKALNPDIIISFMHWGYEYHEKPNLKQIRMSKMMIREGVDHIIGAHPHVVQPVEIRDGHLIAYSLGNFISNQKKKLTDGGIMVEFTVIKDKDKTQLHDWKYIPVWRYRNRSDGLDYEIIPTNQFIDNADYFYNKSDFQAMQAYHTYINNHLSDR